MECVTNVAHQFWAQTVNGLSAGSIYAMIALGYTMVYGVLQLINFAHSEVFMVSVVVTLYSYRNWWSLDAPQSGIVLVLILLTTVLAAMAVSGLTAVT
ncbi:MAG TPA: branched-chain amino acid ABC transporter permease, partial [Actinomycetota bacterium]|nr:branched-chain amino acid ABC transporter permease [Actinomycetota bacterium]